MPDAQLKAHGGDRQSEDYQLQQQDQGDNVTLKAQGNSAAYVKARLKRDHPEIAEQRRKLVIKLRDMGHSHQRIADAVGTHKKTVQNDLKAKVPAGQNRPVSTAAVIIQKSLNS